MDVVTVAFINNKKLLVVKPRSSINSGKYTLIGGKVKQNESFIEALKREVLEELNIELNDDEVKLVLNFSELAASSDNLMINMHMFISNKYIYNNPTINEEILDYKWIDINNYSNLLSSSIENHLIPFLKTLSL